MSHVESIIRELKASLPPVFAGHALDELTGQAIRWRTVQNLRALRQIPAGCFVNAGRRVLVRRDPFLDWWGTRLHVPNGLGAA